VKFPFEADKVKIGQSKRLNRIQLFSVQVFGQFMEQFVFTILENKRSIFLVRFIYWNSSFCHFILNLLRSNQSEILFDDIKFYKVKQRFEETFRYKIKKTIDLEE
jgi:hypothetical protein